MIRTGSRLRFNIPPIERGPADYESGQPDPDEPDRLLGELEPGDVFFEKQQPGLHAQKKGRTQA